jgi:hypothetical protein
LYWIAACLLILSPAVNGTTPDVTITFCHYGNDYYSYTIPGKNIINEWQAYGAPRDSFDYVGLDMPSRDTAWVTIDLRIQEPLTDTQHILVDNFTYRIGDTSFIFVLDDFNDPACLKTWRFVNGYDNGSSIRWYQHDDTPAADSGKSLEMECFNSLGGLYYCALGKDIWKDHGPLVTTPEKVSFSFWLKKGAANTGITPKNQQRTCPEYTIRSTGTKVYIRPEGKPGKAVIRACALDGTIYHVWHAANGEEAVWDISSLGTGIYIVFIDKNGTRFFRKIFYYPI